MAACSGESTGGGDAERATIAAPPSGAVTTALGTTTIAAPTTAPLVIASVQGTACPVAAVRPSPSAGVVRINVWNQLAPSSAVALDALVRQFMADHPNVEIVVTPGKGRADLDGAGSDRPTLAVLDLGDLVHISAKRSALPLRTCARAVGLDIPTFIPVLDAASSFSGDLRVIPAFASVPVIVFNRQRFAAAGLDPAHPPAVPADLFEAATKLVSSGAASTGFAMDSSQAPWVVEDWRLGRGQTVLDPGNGWDGPATELAIDDAATAADLSAVRSAVVTGAAVVLDPSPLGIGPLVRLVDKDHPAGIALASSGSLVDVRKAAVATGLDAQLGVAPMPMPRGGTVPGGSGFYLLPAGAQETGAALELLAYVASAQAQVLAASLGPNPPMLPGLATDTQLLSRWAATPELRVAYDALVESSGQPALRGIALEQRDQLRSIEQTLLRETADGGDPESLLARATDIARTTLRGG